MSKLRVVGDIHGCINNRARFNDLPSYIELCQQLCQGDYSIQLGDLGFDYTDLSLLHSDDHKVLLGNHENYDIAFNYPHMLGDYGLANLGPFEFFYVRGGFSIDKAYRVQHQSLTGIKSWWKEEELTYEQGTQCLELYESIKPDVVMSHDAPTDVSYIIGNPDILLAFGISRDFVSITQTILQNMLSIHVPKLWLHGHYHLDRELMHGSTKFICVGERHYIDFDENWNIIGKTKNA